MEYSAVAADEALLAEDKSFFAWIVSIFTLSDEKYLQKCGSDAVQYLKFQRHLITFTFVIMMVCVCVILPINFQGSLQGSNQDFGHTTISNLKGSDDWLWVHVIVVILFFPLGVFFMRRFSVGLNLTKSEDEAGQGEEVTDEDEGDEDTKETYAAKTLMISGVPPAYCTKDVLTRHFREAYPAWPVEDVQPAYNVSKLTALDAKLDRARKARVFCERNVQENGAGQQMSPRTCGIIWLKCEDGLGSIGCTCCKTVDALSFYTREEQNLRSQVEREKARVKTKSIGIAFVTFASAEGARKVASDYTSGAWFLKWFSGLYNYCFGSPRPKSSMTNLLEPDSWSVRFSPPPDDIYWENLHTSHRYFIIKSIVVNLGCFLFLFFATSPTYILTNMRVIYALKNLTKLLNIGDQINDFLPTMLLYTLATLLPILVAYSDWLLGHWRRSAENLWIMRKVFIYLLFLVLILPSIGGTTLEGMVEYILRNKGHMKPIYSNDTIRWDCIFLPNNGAFFVNYVITSSLFGTAIEFLRFSELFMYALRLCFARSVAEIASVRSANLYEFMFGYNYGWMLLIFAMTCAYCVVCPLITPFGLFYLVMKHGVDRYNLFYAYKRSKISKQIHATAVNCVIVCLLLQQLVLLFFNMLRGSSTLDSSEGHGPLLSARAIFSITMFTIFSGMFVLQIFFHMFMGISPIQYMSEEDTAGNSSHSGNKPSSASSSSSMSSEEAAAAAAATSTEGSSASNAPQANGTAEAVYGEFKAFELSNSDLSATKQRVRGGGTSRAARKRQRLRRQYVPEVLRSDVFGAASATGGGLVTAQALAASVEREMLEVEENDDTGATFTHRQPPTNSHYGATV